MLRFITLAASGVEISEGEGTVSNMTHWLAIVIFIVLWRFHRVMGKLILDKNGAGKVAPSSSTLSAPISKTLDSPSMTKRSCFFYQEAADVPSEDDIWLQNQAPDATCAERKRFYLARNTIQSAWPFNNKRHSSRLWIPA